MVLFENHANVREMDAAVIGGGDGGDRYGWTLYTLSVSRLILWSVKEKV